MGPHLSQVYQTHRPITWEVLNDLRQRTMMETLDEPIQWEDLIHAIAKLSNGKAPELNEVPPDACNALNSENLSTLLNFLNEFWEGRADFSEWHEGQMVPVPKKGDLGDPMWVLFADLIKVLDTLNHKLMTEILGKYRCPPKLLK